MRIVVNDIAASKTGALSILRDFYNYIKLSENREIETKDGLERLEWVFLLSDNYIEETDNIRVITLPKVKGWKKRLAFELISGGAYIMSLKPDIYFSMQNTLTRGVKCKTAVYVHQPLCFQRVKNFSLFKAEEREYAIYQHIIGRLIYSAIRRADRTIVQTEWMRDEAIRRTKVSGLKVVKITPDIDVGGDRADTVGGNQAGTVGDNQADTVGEASGEHAGLAESFSGKRFFYPSGDMLYKNHVCIVRAAELLKKQGISDFEIVLTLTREELLRICPLAGELLIKLDGEKQIPLSKLCSTKSVRHSPDGQAGLSTCPIACGNKHSQTDTEKGQEKKDGSKITRNGGIVCLGRLSRKEVLSYYKKSVLLFPSYIESFGYPPAEARAMGGAILASDTPSSLEVLSEYDRAFYFDPFRPEELCELMKDAIEGKLFAEGAPSLKKTDGNREGLQDGDVISEHQRDPAQPVGSDDSIDRQESSWAKVLQVLTE
ncbi:MAG: glycosyltransferase [Lachnospiraceae bacterium]|nr:glycosyltransferase [Lachnospiraceae bacterium]